MSNGSDTTANGYSDLIIHTQSMYSSLTKSEKKVADLLLSDASALVYDTISDVADKADVGDATVLRFCRSLGFKGFFPFRLALAQYLTENRGASPANNGDSDTLPVGTPGIVRRAVQDAVDVLGATASILDPNAVDEVTDKLCSAKGRICFFGLGTSNNAAMEAVGKFMRIGIRAEAVSDTHMQLMMASLLGPEDIAVGFSVSGSTKDTQDIMQAAKQAGAVTICVTGNARSPIGKQCDAVLLMASRESPFEGGSAEARLSQSLVINILSRCVLANRADDSVKARKKVTRAIENRLL